MLQKVVGFYALILCACWRCVESSAVVLEAKSMSGELQFWAYHRITLERHPVFPVICGFILKGQIPCPFWSTCLSESLLESMAIAKPLFPGVSSRCSCPCLYRPSPIRVPLCFSFSLPPGSGTHPALSQHSYWSGRFHFQPEEALRSRWRGCWRQWNFMDSGWKKAVNLYLKF